jgi:hypothetical protein
MIKNIPDEIDPAGGNREDLVIGLDLKAQLRLEVFPDMGEKQVQLLFARRQDHHIVKIPEIITDHHILLKPVIETGKVKIGEILTEIIADRKPGRAIYNLFQEPQKFGILELSPK